MSANAMRVKSENYIQIVKVSKRVHKQNGIDFYCSIQCNTKKRNNYTKLSQQSHLTSLCTKI